MGTVFENIMEEKKQKPKFYTSFGPFPRLTAYNESIIPSSPKFNEFSMLKSPILKEFNEKLVVIDPLKPTLKEEETFKWLKESMVTNEWHPPQKQNYNLQHDKAFLKWYREAMNKELEELSHLKWSRGYPVSDDGDTDQEQINQT